MNMFAYTMFIRETDPELEQGTILIGAVKLVKVPVLSWHGLETGERLVRVVTGLTACRPL